MDKVWHSSQGKNQGSEAEELRLNFVHLTHDLFCLGVFMNLPVHLLYKVVITCIHRLYSAQICVVYTYLNMSRKWFMESHNEKCTYWGKQRLFNIMFIGKDNLISVE